MTKNCKISSSLPFTQNVFARHKSLYGFMPFFHLFLYPPPSLHVRLFHTLCPSSSLTPSYLPPLLLLSLCTFHSAFPHPCLLPFLPPTENGFVMVIWVGQQVASDFISKVFGAPSHAQINTDMVGQPSPRTVSRGRCHVLKILFFSFKE